MKAVVLFPGVRYSCDTPLLYYAGTVFRSRGYQVFQVDYDQRMLSTDSLEQRARAVSGDVLAQVQAMGLEEMEDVVFVSKSVGTVLAGWTAEQLPFLVRHIYLTPLEPTLPCIHPETDVAVGAGDDPYLDGEVLRRLCEERGIPLTMYPGVGHRLEDKRDHHRTLEILKEIVELYERF